eukprot:TRINITY_DN1130_c0_g1_i1.p1 TRINITY_DN1130_c0_g1~~TRINITY_DN1130_c0_g1_i1.p1  ORF type:complete len:387 (+),score=138.90 TRINITY_DN1130_c0_g1_i1:109-1269(+)
MSKSTESKDILKGLQKETLQDLYLKEHPDKRGEKLSKTVMVGKMTKTIEETGIKALFTNVTREHLQQLVEESKTQLKAGETKNSKVVLMSRLSGAIGKGTLEDFLAEHASEDLLHKIAQDLDVDAEDEKKEGLLKDIVEVVHSLALESYFGGFDVDLLQDVADDLKIQTHNSHNKRKLVEAISTRKDIDKAPKAKKQKVDDGGKKKKAIKKGITYEEIFQHYYVTEVRDFCKDNGLKTSGKKAALIRRILAWLDGDDESTKAKPKDASSKKASSSSTKRSSSKKGSDKDEEAEEEEEDDEEEEEEEQTATTTTTTTSDKKDAKKPSSATTTNNTATKKDDTSKKAAQTSSSSSTNASNTTTSTGTSNGSTTTPAPSSTAAAPKAEN